MNGVACQRVLHLDGGDVLATGNDDVLRPVQQLDVTIRVAHPEVAGVEPAAAERRRRRARVAEVLLHHRVPAHHDFPHGDAVGGHVD